MKDDKLTDPGCVTVYCNGVLVQDHTQLEGRTGHKGRSKPRPVPGSRPAQVAGPRQSRALPQHLAPAAAAAHRR